MPTFKATIRKQQLRRDGKYPVSIRVTHNRQSVYIPTGLYIEKRQASKYYEIKDQFVLERTNQTIRQYEKKLLSLDTEDMRNMPVRSIAALLTHSNTKVDYSAFCEKIIAQNPHRYNSLKNALAIAAEIGYPHLMMRDVDDVFLQKFKGELDRREVPTARMERVKKKKVAASTKNRYLQQMGFAYRQLLVELGPAAKDMNIDNPFERLTYYKREAPKKGSIPVEDLRAIFAYESKSKTINRTKDMLMMSFCLGGMNIGDLMRLKKSNFDGTYLKYQRNKTKETRADGAWTSIKVQPEIEGLFEKYRAKRGELLFDFGFEWQPLKVAARIGDATERLCKQAGVPHYNPYLFRHTVASIARNKFRYSRDDVGMLLNHRGPMTVDDVYIDDDFSINDEINRKILDYVFHEG